ncbi:MAG: Mu-like prophage major head subunit gpT family protein [Pseudomonadota bacterium]|nr:Mu-like prophage major head subunit gpT family protein [Pseudomonadota bacterium]
MGAKSLGSRAIIGEFYARLEQNLGNTWVPQVSMLFQSDQESENYKWLGQAPAMREWIGGRQAKGFRENGMVIANKKYESTLEVPVDWLRRDKTGQIMVRIDEQSERANAHWAKLLNQLVLDGESKVCYDGQFFFDTDHSEGDSGTQDNDIAVDVTTTTAPTTGEMETAILKGVQQIIGFKDDQGEPMNENAQKFLVMVPVPFMSAAAAALGSSIIVDASTSRSNTILTLSSMAGFQIALAVNPRLTWTTKLAVFRADGSVAPFIRQEEEGITVDAIAEGSEEEFKNDRHLYGIKAIRNVGYGYWQKACLVTLT